MSVNVCMIPNCGRAWEARGLCHRHYTLAKRLVWRGKTSWEDMERRGVVAPATRGPSLKDDATGASHLLGLDESSR